MTDPDARTPTRGDADADPRTIELPDGRTLAYAEYGDPGGTPVFGFHGVPGSRRLWSLLDGAAAEQGVRLVAPDRPGFGGSTFQPGRTFLDWPADVTALADHLGVERFGVVGLSGGGPHAAACAHEVPGRLRGAVLVSSVAPPGVHRHGGVHEQGLFAAMQAVPGFSLGVFGVANWFASNARPAFRTAMASYAGAPDRALLADGAGDVLVADAATAFEGGSRGPAHEFPMLDRDWGFDPGDVGHPVSLWHGRADVTVRLESARGFADALPDADLTVVGDAHYSTLLNHGGAVLDVAAD